MAMIEMSVYIAYLLRHNPGSLELSMDIHGWVSVEELLKKINVAGKYHMTKELLDEVVQTDNKGRFRYSQDGMKIKACQGHSISWVEPELTYVEPPQYLYHGTTMDAYQKILDSGFISKMSRHAVHMQAEAAKAWQSAKRWRKIPVVLKIDAETMHANGAVFGVSDNGVWCIEAVPAKYIVDVLEQ